MSEKQYKEVTVGGEPGEELSFLKPADLTELEGTFLGIMEGQYGANYKIQTDSGIIVVNGCSALNKAMAAVEAGADIKLVNRGKKKIKGGDNAGKSFHDIGVFVA